MTRPLAILVRGHAPGRGARHGDWSEYDAIPEYLLAAELRMRAEGIDVIRLELGSLSERQRRGREAMDAHRAVYPDAPCLYVSCHLNAGGPDFQRSVLFHDARSGGGRIAARAIVGKLGLVYEWPCITHASTPDGWLARPHNCISAIYSAPANCCAVLVELAAVDREPLDRGLLRRGGMQLGAGIADYLHSELPS